MPIARYFTTVAVCLLAVGMLGAQEPEENEKKDEEKPEEKTPIPEPRPRVNPPRVDPYAGLPVYGNPLLNNTRRGAKLTSESTDPYAGLSTPYTPGGAYTPPAYYIPTPGEGFLRGTGELLRAQGQYGIDRQRARLLNQQAEQAKIETRRRLFEEYLYERANTPTYEEIREKQQEQALVRAKNQPPLTEILSGQALNTLMSHIVKQQAKGVAGPTVKLSPELLKQINVTTKNGGNVGLLRNEGKLSWPLALEEDKFKEQRETLDDLAKDAFEQANVRGKVDASLLKRMDKAIDEMRTTLEANVVDLSPSQYIRASRYLNLLKDAWLALQDPNIKNYFSGIFALAGKDVALLADYMQKNGLAFAAAVPGDEGAYRAMHTALVSFANEVDKRSSQR